MSRWPTGCVGRGVGAGSAEGGWRNLPSDNPNIRVPPAPEETPMCLEEVRDFYSTWFLCDLELIVTQFYVLLLSEKQYLKANLMSFVKVKRDIFQTTRRKRWQKFY